MKTITFTQYLTAHRDITILIKDEELFKQKSQEWLEEEGSLNHWNLEEEHFDGCVQIDYSDIDWTEEDNDEYFDVMSENNYETYPD